MSIILPVFNASTQLRLLLSSLLEQTHSSLEIIAVDDGSTDDSAQILRSFASGDARLRLFQQPNQGVAAARNSALAKARGRWIAFADSDDWFAPELLSTWVAYAESETLDLLIGNAFRFSTQPNRSTATSMLRRQPWQHVLSGEEWIIRSAAREWPHQVWLQLIRHDFLRANGLRFIDGLIHEDIPWTLRLALAAKRVGFVATPLYGYRRNPDSLTGQPSASAMQRRTSSYVRIVPQLALAAADTANPRLRSALLHHAHFECARCIALLRKRVHDPRVRAEIADAILASEIPGLMFRGATCVAEQWDALRDVSYCLWFTVVSRVFPSQRGWLRRPDTKHTSPEKHRW